MLMGHLSSISDYLQEIVGSYSVIVDLVRVVRIGERFDAG